MIYYRRCIQIKGTDSPNVAFALWQHEQGMEVTGSTIVPGVLSWQEYKRRLKTFSKQRKTESIDAEWYEGSDERLVSEESLQFAIEYAKRRPPSHGRCWMGVDSGEGGDDTCWCIGDKSGILHIVSLKTPDTNTIYGRTCTLVREWNLAWKDVWFDYGGGGKEHVDRLRASNFMVQGLRFGSIKRELKRGMTQFKERVEVEAENASYVNRRSEMAYAIRLLLERQQVEVLDSRGQLVKEREPFAIPLPMCEELCRQIRCIPQRWDDQGRFKLIRKKNSKDASDQETFMGRIGRSPDQFDAFCLMVYGMNYQPIRSVAGTM